MTRWNVYVTNEIPELALDMLAKHCDMEVNRTGQVLTKNQLLEKVKGRDAVLSLLTDPIDAEVMDAAKGAKIFANYAVGYNNIDIPSATERGVMVSNTPGVLTDTTAEMTWALLFSVARRVVESDKYTRMGKYKGWGPMLFLGQDVMGKTLGVIGAGRIGLSFAKRAKAFDMKVLYSDITASPQFEQETGGQYVSLETLLQESDFVSIHTPLLPETYHLIGEKELKLMKKTAILINTSRGPVVDELALVKALQSEEIWGAGLDVYEFEPEFTAGLMELDNAILCPHIASATIDTRTKMGTIAVSNILAAMRGELPPNCLNPEVYKK
ncbi:D-glycerate dehydrogenase [Desulfosporosinus fructosivorans]|uniref:D-glycerate dehydrogenase n=1 Tax=Desulfosporosinus fructosivorans TaxID=2018669 RepID=A0A4Z0R867_9FIRM|nr:D-glycerate dehydrogenase [Desulfosporosinus fructosivorans]TGE38439.1 D-glycerate dehydrogenase [Desulfosporosinus fructosivorans]